jgi:two-component system CheB/CheR fusion protein
VTEYFRDADAWKALETHVVAPLIAGKQPGEPVRIWIPGCSTGEEAYTMAMVMLDSLRRARKKCPVQIFATDIQTESLHSARKGVFPASIASVVPAERLQRFFVNNVISYSVLIELRESILFAEHNLIMDPPFSKIDIVVCRNLLIYFSAELQKKLLQTFYHILNPNGLLFLGSAESVGEYTNLFDFVDRKANIFVRNNLQNSEIEINAPTQIYRHLPFSGKQLHLKNIAQTELPSITTILAKQYAPPAVLIKENGDIVEICGRTGKYLEPAAGIASQNILTMAREGLSLPLSSAIRQAVQKKSLIQANGILFTSESGTERTNIHAQLISDTHEAGKLLLITFGEPTAISRTVKQEQKTKSVFCTRSIQENRNLNQANEELRALREELSNSTKNLTYINEELQSTNEELQSTNEELMTSKEEMQSLNEELHTVNAELEAKNSELLSVNSDLQNILNSAAVATIFVDSKLNIRKFNTAASKIVKLISGDVGRPLSDLTTILCYPTLSEDALDTLRTLVPTEKPVLATDNNRYIARIIAYRTINNTIDGLAITFTNFSHLLNVIDSANENSSINK